MFSPLFWQFCELFDCITLFGMAPRNFQQGNILSRKMLFSSGDAAGRVNSILGQKIMLQHENCLLWCPGTAGRVVIWIWIFRLCVTCVGLSHRRRVWAHASTGMRRSGTWMLGNWLVEARMLGLCVDCGCMPEASMRMRSTWSSTLPWQL